MLRRSAPMRRTPLKRTGWLRRTAAKIQRRRDTGPDKPTRLLIWDRSMGNCEWPWCLAMAVDVHHRLNRKSGGRMGAMRALLNSPPWLLAACRFHHEFVTNPVGPARVQVEAWGWLLREGQNAEEVPVRTGHWREPVWLTADGGWVRSR